MEREKLICVLIGHTVALFPDITADDARIVIDQKLAKANYPPLGAEPTDAQTIQESIDELQIFVLGKGMNRAARRRNL